MTKLLLGSSSRYRRELLNKLGIPFEWATPDIDESPLTGEGPSELVLRLAEAKARHLSTRYTNYLIIGADQVASFNGKIIGKPGNFNKAKEQLLQLRNQSLEFYTGLCLFNAQTQNCHLYLSTDKVQFRNLSEQEIDNYLHREQPFDCAGSFKSEGLGISLFTSIQSQDPSSLIGLPLIGLIDLLEKENIRVLAQDPDRQ
jgi:septum formation protein